MSGRRTEKPNDDVKSCGFSRAVGAQKAGYFSAVHGKINAPDNFP
jgi:hypothetical protein